VILAGISRPLISGFLVLRSSPSDTTTKLAIRRRSMTTGARIGSGPCEAELDLAGVPM